MQTKPPTSRPSRRTPPLRALSDMLADGAAHTGSNTTLDGTLDGLLQHARLLQKLQNSLQQTLPPTMAQGCRVANLVADTVTVLCNHPSLAARLRQSGPSLINAWRQAGFACSALDVRVRPALPTDAPARPPVQRAPLSDVVQASLHELENTIHDEGLKQALARLRERAG